MLSRRGATLADMHKPRVVAPPLAPKKAMSPAAERALTEAAARRAERERASASTAEEFHGRGGLDPVRYGDWEVKGIASDFRFNRGRESVPDPDGSNAVPGRG